MNAGLDRGLKAAADPDISRPAVALLKHTRRLMMMAQNIEELDWR
jgi:hypothetical protein